MIQAVVFAASTRDRSADGRLIVPYVRAVNSLGPLSMTPATSATTPATQDQEGRLALLPPTRQGPVYQALDPLGVEDVKRILWRIRLRAPTTSDARLGDIELGRSTHRRARPLAHLAAPVRAPTARSTTRTTSSPSAWARACWPPASAAERLRAARRRAAQLALRYNLQLPDNSAARAEAADLRSPAGEQGGGSGISATRSSRGRAILRPLPWLTPYLRYKYFDKQRDEVPATRGLSYESLMDLTDAEPPARAGSPLDPLLASGRQTQVPSSDPRLRAVDRRVGTEPSSRSHSVALEHGDLLQAF